MFALLIRRVLGLVPILLGISFISFILVSLSPSDPDEVAIRVNAMVPTPELIAQTRHELGLDEQFFIRYFHWLGHALQGDFGRSYVNGHRVIDDMLQAFPATIYLALVTLAIIVIISVTLGMLCARFEGGFLDKIIRGFVFICSAFPNFWAGLLLMWLFAVELNLLPTSGMRSPESIVLPAITLSLAYVGTYLRLIRAEMIRTQHENWVTFARARGLSEFQIQKHILWNSLRGTITALGMSIPKLIAGAFVVESIFAWPGIGRLCVTAIFNRDFPIIQAYILMMAVLFVTFNLLADLCIAWMDPRERNH